MAGRTRKRRVQWKEQLMEYENLVYNHSLDPKTVNEMFSISQ